MKWTKNKPIKPGWYWFDDNLCDSPLIGEVTIEDNQLWFNDNCELTFKISKGKEEDETRWAGPIPEPV